jgi:hypothetical protein
MILYVIQYAHSVVKSIASQLVRLTLTNLAKILSQGFISQFSMSIPLQIVGG